MTATAPATALRTFIRSNTTPCTPPRAPPRPHSGLRRRLDGLPRNGGSGWRSRMLSRRLRQARTTSLSFSLHSPSLAPGLPYHDVSVALGDTPSHGHLCESKNNVQIANLQRFVWVEDSRFVWHFSVTVMSRNAMIRERIFFASVRSKYDAPRGYGATWRVNNVILDAQELFGLG